MSLNKVMLIGNLGHDPEIRYMPESKRAVTNLSIAMNDSFTDGAAAGGNEPIGSRSWRSESSPSFAISI
jgi:single stranded DNA-binding protein